MNADAQNAKWVLVTPPAAKVDDAAVTTTAIDTAGYDFLEIAVLIGDIDIAATVEKVQESDASNMASAADITGLVTGTSNTIDGALSVLAAAASADNTIRLYQLDLRGRKRYIDLGMTIGDGSTGAYVAVVARLCRAAVAPVTQAEMGCGQVLRA